MFPKKFLLLLVISIIEIDGQNATLTILPTLLPTPLYKTAAVYDGDDSIYILGGSSGPTAYDSIYKFSISTESIQYVASLGMNASSMSAFWDGASVVSFGGRSNFASSPNIRRYIPGSGGVTHDAGTLPWGNYDSSIVQLTSGKECYLFGGGENGNRVVRYSKNMPKEVLDSRLPIKIYGASAIGIYDYNAYLFGGFSGAYMNTILEYNLDTGESVILPQTLPVSIHNSAAVNDATYAWIIGGHTGLGLSGVLRFHLSSKNVETMNVANFPRDLEGAGVVYVPKHGRAYIFGGRDEWGVRDAIMYLSF